MDNQFLNEIVAETLGAKNPETAKLSETQTAETETPQETVEQTTTATDEVQNTTEANVENAPVENTSEQPQQVVEEQTQEQPAQAQEENTTAWYDSDGETQQQTVDYTETFTKHNINLEDPKSIIDALEKAQSPDIPAELDVKVVKDFAKYIKDGGDVKEFMDTYVATNVNDMSDKDVFVAYLKNVGADGDELQAAIKDFDEMPKYKQRLQTQRLRVELETAQSQKLSDLAKRQENAALAQRKAAEEIQRNVETTVDDLVGKTYKGLKIDGNMAKAIKNEIVNLSFTNKDGSVNIQKLLDIGIWMRYGQDLVKSNVTQAINKGRGQVIDKLSNPSKGQTNTVPNGQQTPSDFAKDYLERGLLNRL